MSRKFHLVFFFISLLSLSSCTKEKTWSFMETTPATFATSTIENKFTGIEVQFIQGEFGTLGYLNVYSQEVAASKEDPKRVEAILQIDDMCFSYKTIRMEGGQRFLLPNAATEKLIEALAQSLPITIYLSGNHCQLNSEHYLAQFKKLQKNLS